MEIPVLAVAAYLAAMVLAARYLLVLPSGQAVSVGMGALLVIFLLYAILTNPGVAADIVGRVWDLLYGGLQNLFSFFNELLNN